jgi:hypothetical protein
MAAFFLIALYARPPIFSGADNSLLFYLAGLLHLPSSLLFPVLDSAAIQAAPGSGFESMLFPCVIVALLQFLLIAILLRRPWRRRHSGSVA